MLYALPCWLVRWLKAINWASWIISPEQGAAPRGPRHDQASTSPAKQRHMSVTWGLYASILQRSRSNKSSPLRYDVWHPSKAAARAFIRFE